MLALRAGMGSLTYTIHETRIMYRIISTVLFTACLLVAVGSTQVQGQDKAKKAAEADAAARKREEAAQQEAAALRAKVAAVQAARQVKIGVLMPAPGGATSTSSASGTETQTIGHDEALLRSVGISTDGPSLLKLFRLRSQDEANPEQLAALIEKLSDKSPIVAQKASGELAAIGAPAIPALRQAIKDPDQHQTVLLARRCLQSLDDHPGQLTAAAARLIGQRRPRGAAAALLAFLPSSEDDSVVEEIRLALIAVAYPDGKADPALLQALQDETPLRRALAIDTLCQNGISAALLEQVPLRKLLQDPKPSVRLRAALALARAHDAKAVSTLITLLTELPLDHARQAEDYLSELAGEQAPKTPLGSEAAARQKCRDAWAAWWQTSEDSPRLLEELRKRTLTEDMRQKCENLVKQLGDGDFSVREKAEAEVRLLGAPILPMLRQAIHNSDLEIRRRARGCLSDMERDKSLPLSPVITRLIALRKPAGAAEALLAYTPYADDDAILNEAQIALNTVAFKNGKPVPAVVRALTDALGPRRAAAAEALCLGGDREHLSAIRKLLQDSDPAVRLKTALALAGAREREAVPTLIDLIGELPSAQSAPAEEYLQRVALDRGPASLPPGDGEGGENRKKRRTAWADWWKANGDRVVLVDRYTPSSLEHYHGYTLMVLMNNGTVMELGTDRKPRWQITGLLSPRDAVVVGADRVLIAEWNGQRVTERNLRGEIVWQKQVAGSNPVGVQRLRNGHTFIACQNKLIEVDRGGREVFSITRPMNDVVAARKTRAGQIVLVSTNRVCVRLDTAGKELKSFPIQMVWQMSGVDIRPNGHVIVPSLWTNRVYEYDAEGKSVWEAGAMQPLSVCRLRNGNTLICPQQWPAKVIEVDSAGKQVSDMSLVNHAQHIRSR
ncbi:MAG TPA: HEAT repeat domain-containing protein [Gemmataceae bacterium]|nr:HEAT repeat domain-containing protein [Gemmataceae bacterium]